MTKIIGAPTLDDALSALGKEIGEYERRGIKSLVFCEDRLTLLAERAILGEVGGTFLTEVTTFARFLKGEERVLSKHGSVLEISALIAEHKADLKCFGENAAQAVYETIAQLSASRITPEMLRGGAEETEGVLRYKLSDLALIFEKYNEFLREHALLDENGYLALLPSRITSDVVGDTHVVFFAFQSFTRQALEGVRAALGGALTATGIFLSGKEGFYTREAVSAFRRVAREAGEVSECTLPETSGPEAVKLKSALFVHDTQNVPVPAENIFSFSAADETEEMNTVAACIKRKVAEGKRYRDIAVLIGDESYFLPVLKAFEAYRIPFYADRKRKFSEHPFCTFALNVLAAVSGGPAPDEADDVASSVYFGDDGSYRNYLAKFGGYRGAARRPVKTGEELGGMDAEKISRARDRMCAILDLFKREDTAAHYAEGLRKLRLLVGEEKITETLKAAVSPEEQVFLNMARFDDVLRETEEIAGARKFTARGFALLLKSGLEALEISMLPRRADTVFVGDITTSKICRAPVLFCAGLTDGLPAVTEDTAVITDGEIERLKSLQVEIEPAIAVVNARAREGLALNLIAFSEELFLSCPVRRGEDEAEPSEIFSYVGRVLMPKALPPLFPYDCCVEGPALLLYYAACDERMRGGSSLQPYLSLKEVFEGGDFGHGTPVFPDEMRFHVQKEDTSEAGELYFAREISPTLLEDYCKCPYKSFAERALRLEEREKRTVLDAGDAGEFVHAVLERIAPHFGEFADEAACADFVRARAEELLREPRFASVTDTAAGVYTASRLVKEAVCVACAAYRQIAGSKFRVKAAEAEVRIPELLLRGRVDRVDETEGNVRVIDYKTGSIKEDALFYYTGQKLQLELYLFAAAQDGKRPAGAFYFPAADNFTKEEDRAGKFRMKGFFCSDPAVIADMDTTGVAKSAFYENGKTKGLPEEEFISFLHYGLLVSQGAEREMRAGNIRPSPYTGACDYCSLKGMCAFSGAFRKEKSLSAKEVAAIAQEEEKS